jgi:hypothetical protein
MGDGGRVGEDDGVLSAVVGVVVGEGVAGLQNPQEAVQASPTGEEMVWALSSSSSEKQ